MNLYRKKPLDVIAVLWKGQILPHLPAGTIHTVYQELDGAILGTMKTLEGAYLIQAAKHYIVGPGHKGEFWPVEREIFEATYEEVSKEVLTLSPDGSEVGVWRQGWPEDAPNE
jgi:hypothetical protein